MNRFEKLTEVADRLDLVRHELKKIGSLVDPTAEILLRIDERTTARIYNPIDRKWGCQLIVEPFDTADQQALETWAAKNR